VQKRYFNHPHLVERRKALRNHATKAEKFLWAALKKRSLSGRKFRRQHSIGNYIVDFYCPEEKLIIELDGETHNNSVQEEYDTHRTQFFKQLGLAILRFENKTVFESRDMVLETIIAEFKQPPRPLGTPPSKGGEITKS